MRRQISILLLASCLGLFLLPGCGSRASGTAEDGQVTLVFWHSLLSNTQPALRELLDRFETENPGIRIDAQYVPTGDALVQKLITAVQSGSAPDLSWVRSYFLEDLARADAIHRMDDFIEGPDGLSEEELADIYPALLRYSSWGDTLYALPMEATNLGLLYNKEHFREVGLDPEHPPQSWEELRAYARRLTVDRNGDGKSDRIGFMVPAVPADGPQGPYMMWQWMPYLWQAGGYIIDEAQTRVLFNEAPGVEALTLWKELYDVQQQRNFGNEAMVAFASGQASMIMDGPWNLTQYPRTLKNVDYAITMLPAGPAKRATIGAGEFLSIFKQTKHPEAAWTFVKWMLQPEVQAFWSMKSGYLPVRASTLELPEYRQFLDENPGHRAYAEQMDYALAHRPIDSHIIEIQRNIAIAIEQATVGGRDPKQALDEAAARSNALLQGAVARAK